MREKNVENLVKKLSDKNDPQCPPTSPSFPLFIISMFQFVNNNI